MIAVISTETVVRGSRHRESQNTLQQGDRELAGITQGIHAKGGLSHSSSSSLRMATPHPGVGSQVHLTIGLSVSLKKAWQYCHFLYASPLSRVLQPFDIGCFVAIKNTYCRQAEGLVHTKITHITSGE